MEYSNFEEYLESEYIHLVADFYECNGGHTWHLDDIEEEYKRIIQNPARGAGFNDFMKKLDLDN